MIRPLTSLRFFAALLVYAGHTDVSAPWHAWAELHRLAAAGVAFFFVLSGFILMYTHRQDFANGIRWDATRAFWAARFARIFPLQYVTFFGMIAAAAFGIYTFSVPPVVGCHAWCVTSQLTLTQAWSFWDWNVTQSFNAPAWTISDEAFFYAVFPIACWAILARATRPHVYLCAALVLAICITIAQTIGIRYGLGTAFYYLPPLRLPEFLAGMLVAAAFCSPDAPLLRRSASWLEPAALLMAAAVLIFAEPLPLGWLIPVAAFCIWTFATGGGWLSRLLSWAPFVYLGELSFAFYMVHHIVEIGLPKNWMVLPYSLALSALLYHVVERPARRALRDFLTSRPPIFRPLLHEEPS